MGPILDVANKTLSIQTTFSQNLEDQDKIADDLKINVEKVHVVQDFVNQDPTRAKRQ